MINLLPKRISSVSDEWRKGQVLFGIDED